MRRGWAAAGGHGGRVPSKSPCSRMSFQFTLLLCIALSRIAAIYMASRPFIHNAVMFEVYSFRDYSGHTIPFGWGNTSYPIACIAAGVVCTRSQLDLQRLVTRINQSTALRRMHGCRERQFASRRHKGITTPVTFFWLASFLLGNL